MHALRSQLNNENIKIRKINECPHRASNSKEQRSSQVAFLLNLLYFSLYPTHLKLRSGAGGGGLVTTAAVVATAATAAAAAAGG